MPNTKLTVPHALQENKPFLAWVGVQDLAVEKARSLPELVSGAASVVQIELPKVGQQVSAKVNAKATEVRSLVEARRAAVRSSVSTARSDARARTSTRTAEFADAVAQAYQSLAARGDRVVSAYVTVADEAAEPQAA